MTHRDCSCTLWMLIKCPFANREHVCSVNVGFGLTDILSVILTGLLAKKGAVFIVKNPEAHLHPAGQTYLGMFLAKLQKTAVQVVVESHSKHIFNGLRLAINTILYLVKTSIFSKRIRSGT